MSASTASRTPMIFAYTIHCCIGHRLFHPTFLEFVLAAKKLPVGGVIAFHDLWRPSLRKLPGFNLSNRSYKQVAPSTGKPLSHSKLRISKPEGE